MMRRHSTGVVSRRRRAARIQISLVTGIAAAALAAASVASGPARAAAAVPARAPAAVPDSTPSAVRADMNELFKSFSFTTGTIGPFGWQAAVALSTVETYQQTTGDTRYQFALAAARLREGFDNFEDNFDDDTAWWGLAWAQAYDITHASAYLSIAETDANYIHQDWDNTCGGGIWWQRPPHYYKNAIANELFLELTAWLHNSIRGDTKYLGWAKAEWKWFSASGMISKTSSLVSDGPNARADKGSCVNHSHSQIGRASCRERV